MESAGQESYSSGLTAINCVEYSRDALFQALYNRSCYATTGARILVSFNIAGKPMGSEISTKTKPGLAFNRYIHGFVAGTDIIEEVIIYRNGRILETLSNGTDYLKIEFDDSEPLDKIVVTSQFSPTPHAFYYLKVIQKDGHIAWASPIWIDAIEEEKKGRKK